MASALLVVFAVTSLLSVRSLQQTQVLPANESILEQTTVRNRPEASAGWYHASTHAPQVGKENASQSEDELARVQDRLEKENVTTEDDEHFQDVEEFALVGVACRADVLAEWSASVCAPTFEQQMALLEADARCVLDNVIGAYDQLSECLKHLSRLCGCYYPNAAVHAAFLRLHSAFFRRCPPPSEERHLEDAPFNLVLGLTLAPVALVALLVYAAGMRSKADK
ncbi:receptor activity-modifying protein 1-like [Vanacampus margaritifer]